MIKKDINDMKGTYWYDVLAFMNYVKENVKNEKLEKSNNSQSTQTDTET